MPVPREENIRTPLAKPGGRKEYFRFLQKREEIRESPALGTLLRNSPGDGRLGHPKTHFPEYTGIMKPTPPSA